MATVGKKTGYTLNDDGTCSSKSCELKFGDVCCEENLMHYIHHIMLRDN
ncbi:hypothetical protein [Methanobrevibacter sp.]|nr:hypothetical protein [Methanobrevibacter sp.]MBQ2832158.1 hypothetical protein [Methanobrevibacter sp.]